MITYVKKPLFTISITLYMILFFNAPGICSMVDSAFHSKKTLSKIERQEKVETIQRALETKIVKEKLKSYGLNEKEVNEKLEELSDEQIHVLAQASEKLLAGGDGLSTIITLLVIVILVLVIIKLAK